MIVKLQNNQAQDTLRIEYMLGNLCNHKCYYCFPGSNEGDQPWPDIDIVKQNLGHLLEHYRNNGKPKSEIFFVGGEPTLWKGLPELCTYLKEKFDTRIEISSNGSKSISWWKREAHNFDIVGISVHNEFAKLDHIREVCDILYENNVMVNADVLMDPLEFDKCKENIEYLKANSKYEWTIIAKLVHFSGEHRYTDTQLDYFQDPIKRYPNKEWYEKNARKPETLIAVYKQGFRPFIVKDDNWVIRNKLNYFKDWTCNIGVDFIKIFSSGQISGNCQQILYGDKVHHNLYSKDFIQKYNPKIMPVKCTQDICGCSEEASCTKKIL